MEQVAELTDQVGLVMEPHFEGEMGPRRRRPASENTTEARDACVVLRRHPEIIAEQSAEVPIAEPDVTRSRRYLSDAVIKGPHRVDH